MNRLLIFHPRKVSEIAKSLDMKTKQIFKLLVKLEGVGGQRQTHRGLTSFHPLNSTLIQELSGNGRLNFKPLFNLIQAAWLLRLI